VKIGAASDEMKAAFGRALLEAMGVDHSPAEIAEVVDVSEDAARRWLRGENAPRDPLAVFAIEQHLGCPPGDLSRHLGFVPVGAVSVTAAIEADEALTPEARRILLATYREGRRG
jgi:hypothetical protein